MTATEQLCDLLDERGACYEIVSDTCVDVTEDAQIVEYRQGVFGVQMRNLTAKQAIEATCGRGVCHDAAGGDMSFFACSVCGATIDRKHPKYCAFCGREVVK